MLWTLRDLVDHCYTTQTCIENKWVPTRPINYTSLSIRVKSAWLVFTGKADAVIWPCGQ